MQRQTKIMKVGFTLIELIVVMAVIGMLVLLAAPKFLGYTERAQETKHIHTAKVIETALEAYLIHGGIFPEDLEIVDEATLSEAVNNKSLYGVSGLIGSPDGETYYELTHEFVQKLDVQLSVNNELFIEAMASSVPTALYASEKGITLVDKSKVLNGYITNTNIIIKDSISTGKVFGNKSNSTMFYLDETGAVWSWGKDIYTRGALGLGNVNYSIAPVKLDIPEKIIDINSDAPSSTYAISENGNIYVWGYNHNGRLGLGDNIDRQTPVIIPNFTNVEQLITNGNSLIARKADGTVWAWGWNNVGQLGLNNTTTFYNPTKVEIDNVTTIWSSGDRTHALKVDGTIWAWGINDKGELGLGHTTHVKSPIQAMYIPEFKELTNANSNYNNYAIMENGEVYVWGINSSYLLGLGSNNQLISKFPVKISVNNIKKIAVGSQHAIFIDMSGRLFGVGKNHSGQLALGSTNAGWINSITEISAINDIIDVVASGNTTIGLKQDGTVWVWGYNVDGRLGVSESGDIFTPRQVDGLSDVIDINIINNGSVFTALTRTRETYIWGVNTNGELGLGNNEPRLTPTLISIE